MMTIKTCLALMGALAFTTAYPTGAPDKACGNLNPDSHGPSTATGPPPYKLEFDSDSYKPGQVVKITLAGALFKGFMVVGRKAGDTSMNNVGFFQQPSTSDAKLMCLNGTSGNGVTHTNNTVKSTISLEWKAPSSSVGDVVFHFTVVRGGAPSIKVQPADYFMDIKSGPLKAASGSQLMDLLYEKNYQEVTVVEKNQDGQEAEVAYAMPSFDRLGRRVN